MQERKRERGGFREGWKLRKKGKREGGRCVSWPGAVGPGGARRTGRGGSATGQDGDTGQEGERGEEGGEGEVVVVRIDGGGDDDVGGENGGGAWWSGWRW